MAREPVRQKRSKTSREIGLALGITASRVRQLVSESRQEFLDRAAERRGAVVSLKSQGVSWASISKELEISRESARGLYFRAVKTNVSTAGVCHE